MTDDELSAMNARMAAKRAARRAGKEPEGPTTEDRRQFAERVMGWEPMTARGTHDVDDLIAWAQDGCRADNDSEFLSDIEQKLADGWYDSDAQHQQYTLTEKQYRYLLGLAIRGGFDHRYSAFVGELRD